MSPAVVNGLVLFFTALLFLLLAVSLAPATRPPLNRAAGQALNDLIAGFDEDLREGADTRARMRERREVRKKDIQACYRERRVRRVPGAVEGVTRYRTITFSAASVIFALPAFPHFPHLSSGNKMFADAAGAIVAALGFVFDGSEFARVTFRRRRRPKNRPHAETAGDDLPRGARTAFPFEPVSNRAKEHLRRCCNRLAYDVEKEARRRAAGTETTAEDISNAWQKLVSSPAPIAAASPVVRSRKASINRWARKLGATLAVAGILYFIFSWAKTKLVPAGQLWPFLAIFAGLFTLYLGLVYIGRAIAAFSKDRGLAGIVAWPIRKILSRIPHIRTARSVPGNPPAPLIAGEDSSVIATSTFEPGQVTIDHVTGPTIVNQGGNAKAPPPGSMFSLGWLMAQLFGPLQHRQGGGTTAHLPAVAELAAGDQIQLAFVQLKDLLGPYPSLTSEDVTTAWESGGHEAFTAAITALHLELLTQLAGNPGQSNAYQLGRALSDMCWLPSQEAGADLFLHEFNRYRLATLQTWLAQAGDALAALPAATVSRSLQNWQDWADVNASRIKDTWPTAQQPVIAALRTQARAWHAQLAGQSDMTGPVSPDAWVHAGQSMLRTSRALTLTAARRFWPIVAVLAAATGGLLYLAITSSSGTARVWTSLVTVAAGLGVTGGSVRAAARRAASGFEQAISQAASLDARAWSITWLPTLPQGPLRRYRLASRGVEAPHSRNGLEIPASSAPGPRQPAAQVTPQVP
ncbi:MAG TPA: hypothetical protein VMI33_07435 [Streptosporangiaceae bacterium]|nr:hypothetical protein [Streptosporangiaceae bacterium]